ncbi:LCP family protein [Georgenia sp. TF02-10]|uniref:LCP family protein n=1 Tax=Georgenia sp. TF02-10 TaxID=2917725 RepID=UPI001FA80162|nr:LCP family protein [Georgenia sp. TF02-10]UNX55383.1 LCP family protein [Georgenia sp. TF02-10]
MTQDVEQRGPAWAEPAGPPDRRRRRARAALLIALAILLVLAGAGVAGTAYLQHRVDAALEKIDDPFAALPARPTPSAENRAEAAAEAGRADPVNVLVLGSDSRISAGDPSAWAAGAQRTDALMVAQLAGTREHAYVMSIPRDAWVDVPGHGMNKINAAFSFGGPTLLIQTVEQLTGIPIDHFAVADFESFVALTDELGGVEMKLRSPLEAGGETLGPGEHRLTGEQALAYVRERYDLPRGDFDRVQRQQYWMRRMLQQADREGKLANPLAVADLLTVVSRGVSVDEGFTVAEMRNLLLSMRDLRIENVQYLTAPYTGTGRSPDGQSIVLLNEGLFRGLAEAFATDTVGEYLRSHDGAVETLGWSVPD